MHTLVRRFIPQKEISWVRFHILKFSLVLINNYGCLLEQILKNHAVKTLLKFILIFIRIHQTRYEHVTRFQDGALSAWLLDPFIATATCKALKFWASCNRSAYKSVQQRGLSALKQLRCKWLIGAKRWYLMSAEYHSVCMCQTFTHVSFYASKHWKNCPLKT